VRPTRLALLVVVAIALSGCRSAPSDPGAGYCTPAGIRTTPTAGVSGLVGSVNALPASGVCRAFAAPR
jgi:hypothetical protein